MPILLLVILCLLLGLDSTPLWDQDEAAYAGFAHQMVATGDWRMPAFAWSEVHRKPPLHFWLIAAASELLGERLLTVRLPGALSVLGCGALIARWGAGVFGAAVSRRAGLMLLTSLAMVVGKIGLTDGPLLLAQTAAALALLNHLKTPQLRWCLALWGASAAALLIKGPPVLILIGGMGGLLLLLHPDRKRLLLPLLGMPLAAIPLVAWGWWAWGADGGESIRWMLDFYILDRASGGTALGQTGPPGFYLLTMLLLLFPWAWRLPGALLGMASERGPEAMILASWMAAGWWFYELIPSKLPAYALGAYPAIVLAMAQFEGPRWAARLGVGLTLLVGAGLSAGLIGLAVTAGAATIAVPGVVLAVLGVVAWWRPPIRAVLAPITLALIWLAALPALRPELFLTADVAAVAIETGHPVVIADNYRLPSLPYYLSAAGVDWRMQDGVPPEGETLITTDLTAPPVDAVALDGLIPDKGRPVRFWVVPP